MKSEELKIKIIEAGRKAVEQLIKVAKEDIIKHDPEDEIAADRLKNAAATKKLAVFDAFDILNKIDQEQENINLSHNTDAKVETKQGFAERRSK
jgi:ASC-1-like (ASCH) protein